MSYPTADEENPSDSVKQELESAMSYEGSAEENKARLFCRQLGIDYDKLTKEEFVTLINILKKASLLNNQPVKKHNHVYKKKRK